jgi:hypothetical protein
MGNDTVRTCAQPICLHDEADHRPGEGCRRCACTKYVGRWRMMFRRAYWVLARGAVNRPGPESAGGFGTGSP